MNKIINEVIPDPIYHHGTFFDNCEICDCDIDSDNPGKQISFIKNGQRHIIHVCNACFIDPDYQEILRGKDDLRIKSFSSDGM